MKKVKVVSLILTMIIAGTLFLLADTSTQFKVFGNCSLCKSNIEKTALSVNGVSKANWNEKTKMLEIDFDETKTDVSKVQIAIAKRGYDTEVHKADNKDYNMLLGCCKYDRESIKTDMDCKEDHQEHENSACTRSQMESSSSSCCNKN